MSLLKEIQNTALAIEQEPIVSKEDLEHFRLKYLSKKGIINQYVEAFRTVPNDEKKHIGQPLNQLKQLAENFFKNKQEILENLTLSVSVDRDLSLESNFYTTGSRHPLRQVEYDIVSIFEAIGFVPYEGPEIEDDWHNFSGLNFAEHHPARDMQDTFFVGEDAKHLLRTHTTSVQIRALEKFTPPMKVLMPGRVYRNEAISARAHCFFHQIDGFYINKKVSFADLKGTLLHFAKQFFGVKTELRVRPSYFPFTEPSVEMDVSCNVCQKKGCNVCKYTGWLEILGGGLIHPNILKNFGIDPNEYSGFAFGMGVERISMLKYQIKDLRLFSQNDVAFLNQF